MKCKNRLPYILSGKNLRQKRKSLLLKRPSCIIQHDQGKIRGQQSIIFPPEIIHIIPRIMISSERIDIILCQTLRDLLDSIVIVFCPRRHQIACNQGNIILGCLLQSACINLHVVGSQSLTPRITNDANGVYVRKIDNRIHYFYQSFFVHNESSLFFILCFYNPYKSGFF